MLPGRRSQGSEGLRSAPTAARSTRPAGGSKSINHLTVAAGGQLTFANCASEDGSGGTCSEIPGSAFDGPGSVAVSPTGASVYATTVSSSSLTRFGAASCPDTTPPGLSLKVGKKPQAGKPVKVTVSCTEACSVDLTATAKPKGSKKGSLKPASTDLAAGASATLKLKAKGKLGKALRRSGKGKATVLATASDASGNTADASERVKLK